MENEMTLEEAFSKLDEITKKLENPQLGLEKAFELYREGSKLADIAQKKIDLVQKQVRIIRGAGDGDPDAGPDGAEYLEENSEED